MTPYSKEMRLEALACDRGEGTRAVALHFRCSESGVRRVKRGRRASWARPAPLLTRRRTSTWEPYRGADTGTSRRGFRSRGLDALK